MRKCFSFHLQIFSSHQRGCRPKFWAPKLVFLFSFSIIFRSLHPLHFAEAPKQRDMSAPKHNHRREWRGPQNQIWLFPSLSIFAIAEQPYIDRRSLIGGLNKNKGLSSQNFFVKQSKPMQQPSRKYALEFANLVSKFKLASSLVLWTSRPVCAWEDQQVKL